MHQQSRSIFWACLVGSFIGGAIALDINTRFSWGAYLWVGGPLVGGILGYIIVNFSELCAGFARGFLQGVQNSRNGTEKIFTWRPDRLYWRVVFAGIGAGGSISLSAAVLGVIGWELIVSLDTSPGAIRFGELIGFVLIAVGVVFGMLGVMVALPGDVGRRERTEDHNEYEARIARVVEFNWWIAYRANPFTVLYFIIVGIPTTLFRLSYYLWRNRLRLTQMTLSLCWLALCLVGRCLIFTFKYVHSDIRVLCAVDAALGATAGYYAGSATIGALVGGLLGLVNYEVVSRRWLKLASPT